MKKNCASLQASFLAFLLLLLTMSVQAQAPVPAPTITPTPTSLPLTRVLSDLRKQKTNWQGVLDLATAIAGNSKSNALTYPSAKLQKQSFYGRFDVASNDDRLALLSDDGCSVWINGETVVTNADRLQALPDTAHSLVRIPYKFVVGQTYYIRVAYSNLIYSSDKAHPDIDGVTLFAYMDTITPLPTATPRPTATATPTPTPFVPTLNADKVTKTSAHLYWTAYPTAANFSAYKLFRSNTVGFTPQDADAIFASTKQGDKECNDPTPSSGALTPDTVYEYVLRIYLKDNSILQARCQIRTLPPTAPKITLAGSGRMCAGHLYDAIYQTTITGTAVYYDNDTKTTKPWAQHTVRLNFRDEPPVPLTPISSPPGTIVLKPLAFVVVASDGTRSELSQLDVTTGDDGKFSCTLISSSLITNQAKLIASWEKTTGDWQEITRLALNCASVESRTEYNLKNLGWQFMSGIYDPTQTTPFDATSLGLTDAGGQYITGRIRLMYCQNPAQANVATSWVPVANHQVRIALDKLTLSEPFGYPTPITKPERTPEVISFCDKQGIYIDEKGTELKSTVTYIPSGDVHALPQQDTRSFSIPDSVPTTTDAQGWACVYLKTGPHMMHSDQFSLRVIEQTQRQP